MIKKPAKLNVYDVTFQHIYTLEESIWQITASTIEIAQQAAEQIKPPAYRVINVLLAN